MTRDQLIKKLHELGACQDAIGWVEKTKGRTSELWKKCPCADWMLWLAGRADIDRKDLVMATCQCAKRSLKYTPKGEDRPRKAIETTEAWIRGEATLDDVRAYANAAYAANAVDAAYAAYAAAYAAYAAANAAAYVAANAANDAANAAYAAANAAYAAANAAAYVADAAGYASRNKEIKIMAGIVRKYITWAEVERGLR